VFVSGWAAGPDRKWPTAPLTLRLSGGTEHPVGIPYLRPGLSNRVPIEGECSFLADLPWPAKDRKSARVTLLAAGAVVAEVQLDAATLGRFEPRGNLDVVSPTRLTGWVFDPAMWLPEAPDAPSAMLEVGDDVRLRLPLNRPRPDLVFAGGRPLGFDLAARDIARLLEAHGLTRQALDGRLTLVLRANGSEVARASPPATNAASGADGFVDYFGHCASLGGWLLGGWMGLDGLTRLDTAEATLLLDSASGPVVAQLAWHHRPDVAAFGLGFVAFLPGPPTANQPKGFEVILDRRRRLGFSDVAQLRPEAQLCHDARALLQATGTASSILGLLDRPVFDGRETLSLLPMPLHFEVDLLLLAQGAGVAIIGWRVDPQDATVQMRIVGPGWSAPLEADRWRAQPRPDIQEALNGRYGLVGDRHGFLAFAACTDVGALAGPQALYLEITTRCGHVAFKPLPAPAPAGIAGMRALLGQLRLSPDEVAMRCEQLLAPPIIALNRARLAAAAQPTVIEIGPPPVAPRRSIIVPLYGRVDWMMYQCALFSEHGLPDTELVYVLDDPPRKEETIALALSCWRRFGLPIRLVLLPANLGYAPANNAGLAECRGEYVCFLNSDVLPLTPGWLDLMTEALAADPGLGVVGAVLNFEDGTLQHAGMEFRRLPEWGGFPFPIHPGKGRLGAASAGLRRVEAVTGACMVLSRALAIELGGFDTNYVIGDFEDADLCMRVRDRKLECAVHHGAVLWHLERQSQGSSGDPWRQNLTLVNAWTFAQRWGDRFPPAPAPEAAAVRLT